MLSLQPSATTAPHWTPTLRKWLVSLDMVNLVLLVLVFVFSLSNAIQDADNYRAWLPSWQSYLDSAKSSLLCLALLPPVGALAWMYFQRFLYSRKTLAPWVVMTSSLLLASAWAVTAFWILDQGVRGTGFYAPYIYHGGPIYGQVDKRAADPVAQATQIITDNAAATVTSPVQSTYTYFRTDRTTTLMTTTVTPTRTVLSIASPTETFISSIPQGYIFDTFPANEANNRGVPVSYTVFFIRWALVLVTGILQLFYMSVAARAIDNRNKAKKAGRATANVTFYEPSQPPETLPCTEAAEDARPRSEVPGYEMATAATMPPWDQPGSARGSLGSFESDEKKEAVIKESMR